MTDEFIEVAHEAVQRTFERTEQTEFQREQNTVFVKEAVTRVFYEVVPNGS